MPELPEVETVVNGLKQNIVGKTIDSVVTRVCKLRWPLDNNLNQKLAKKSIINIYRRAKYIIIETESNEFLIMHLGMSGQLKLINSNLAVNKHDHFEIKFKNYNKILRLTDPRRFGAVLYTKKSPIEHKLLINLGPEPFAKEFNAEYCFKRSQKKSQVIKNFIMDQKNVVGVGNIYAAESLFLSKINPNTPANKISLALWQEFIKNIKAVLKKAIKTGGTTLKDFVNHEGKPGMFKQKLWVYGRENQSCFVCENLLIKQVIGQRSTVYCNNCQVY